MLWSETLSEKVISNWVIGKTPFKNIEIDNLIIFRKTKFRKNQENVIWISNAGVTANLYLLLFWKRVYVILILEEEMKVTFPGYPWYMQVGWEVPAVPQSCEPKASHASEWNSALPLGTQDDFLPSEMIKSFLFRWCSL